MVASGSRASRDYSERVARLTRIESKERTRRQLLDAARPLFLEHGFHACSVELISEAAGFSTGAVYSNFGGKTQLAMHVLDELYLRETQKVTQILVESTDQSLDGWMAFLQNWVQQTIGEPRWARFELELTSVMATNEDLVGAVASRYATLRGQIGALASTQTDPSQSPATSDWNSVGTLLLGLVLGVALQRIVDPELPVSPVPHGLKALIQNPPPL